MTDIQLPDAWVLDSGLREDMILTIHSSYFAPDAAYMDGNVLMLNLIGVDENEEPVTMKLSVGADWTTDDGNVITHPTKKRQVINMNSIYGHWITCSLEIPALRDILLDRGSPTDARVWMDLVIGLENHKIEFGPRVPAQTRLMPTTFEGLYSDTPNGSVATATPATAPASDPMAAVNAARAAKAAQNGVSNGSPLYARAVEMAKAAPDFATFLATALADDEILLDDDLAVQVADEALVWAAAH